MEERYKGCLLGLACGDAVGTTVEFKPRGTFPPVTDMVGGGPFDLAPGEWTDDTSMALCLAVSLLEKDGFDPDDQMARYVRWWTDGYLSSTGACFDIGNTVAGALRRYRQTGEPYSGSTDPYTAGNGSIMRLPPVPMFYAEDLAQVARCAAASSRTTHGAQEAVDACRLFGVMIALALRSEGKETVSWKPGAGSQACASRAPGHSRLPFRRSPEATTGRRRARRSAAVGTWWRAWRRRCGASGARRTTGRPSSWPPIWGMTPTRRRLCAARSQGRTTGSRGSPGPGWRSWRSGS
jgi:ADP-ribosylglycohydrolase